ncbi:MAG: hypothetical protein KAV83_00020 [Desulfobacterales bacterium]|nr:hypothetical protein [Desulfobacterales bacterium]
MTILLDNTILSNFSTLRRPDLVRQAFLEEVVTTEHVFREMQVGVAIGRIPPCDWEWLKNLALTSPELGHFRRLTARLGEGEASCVAVAVERGYRLATDDKDARQWCRKLGIPHTGTIGILAVLAKKGHIALSEGNRLLGELIDTGYRSPLTKLDELLL